MSEHRILLVDDEAGILNALKRVLRQGCADGLWGPLRIESFTDPAAALARICECRFSLVITDYRMPGINGVELLAAVREQQPECVRVILSGQTDHDGLLGAINQAQIARFLSKPWNERELLYAVRVLLQAYEAQIETLQLAEQQRLALGLLSPQDLELRRLERLEPGLTHVERSSDGAYILEPLPATAP